MNPYPLFLLLIFSQMLMANEPINVKFMAKQKEGDTLVKFGLYNVNITTPEYAKRHNIPHYYFPSIVLKAGKETLVTEYLSPYFNGFTKLKFEKIVTNDTLTLLVSDSKGQIIKKDTSIKKHVPSTKNIHKKLKDFSISKTNVFEATSSDEAIKALYGSSQTVEGNFSIKFKGDSLIELDDGMCSSNGGRLRISIDSKIRLSSLAIFQDGNAFSTIAVFDDTHSCIYQYDLDFKMRKTSIVRVVGKGIDGILYESQTKMYIITSSHRDCYGDVSGPYMVY